MSESVIAHLPPMLFQYLKDVSHQLYFGPIFRYELEIGIEFALESRNIFTVISKLREPRSSILKREAHHVWIHLRSSRIDTSAY
jgi:hypothetical protein